MVLLTPSEAKWLEDHYPGLKPNEDLTQVAGEISFRAAYDKVSDLFSIIRSEEEVPPGIVLHGDYRVKIEDIIDLGESRWLFPRLSIQDSDFTFSVDRHFSGIEHKTACLFGPSEEARLIAEGYSFLPYLEKHVIPFLYAQKYYDEHGEWPWAEYDHGTSGALHSHLQSGDFTTVGYTLISVKGGPDWPQIRQMLVSKTPPRGHMPCYCGKSDYIRRCHPETWEALKKFYADFKASNITLPPVSNP